MEHHYCTKCVLPTDYIGIQLDENGVCQYCRKRELAPIKYLGKEKLKEAISDSLKRNTSKKYDCVVGFSGGRDSTYLLWYVVKELKLRPIAVFADDGFIPEQMLENIKHTARVLGVELVCVAHPYLKRCVKHHLSAWIKRPVAESLICLNVGERLGYLTLVEKEAIKHGIKLIFSGGSPFQQESYKTDIVKINKRGGSVAWMMGWIKQALLNPSLLLNFNALKTQYLEFTNNRRRRQLLNKHGIQSISPYFKYVHWVEKDIEKILKEDLDWKVVDGFKSTCRVGCEMDTLRQYLFYRILGYNDKNVTISEMVRDGQITQEEAIRKMEIEHTISEEMLKPILDKIGIDSDSFMQKLNKRYPIKK